MKKDEPVPESGGPGDRDSSTAILDDFPNPIWKADTEGRCIYFNKCWLAFTGRTFEQEYGDGWAEGVHPEDLDRCLAIYRDHFAARTPFEMEYRLRYHDGTYRWLYDSGKPRFTPDGEFSGYIGSCYDIQDRRTAEEALRESEQRNAAMIAAMPDLLFILSRDGTYLDFQAADARLLAIPADRIIGKNIFDPDFDPEAAKAIHRGILAAIETGTLQQVDYRLAVPAGLSWFEARIVRLSADRVLGVVRDITAIRTAEEALNASRQLFADIISFLPDPTFVIDRDGKVLAWNRAMETLSGVPATEMMGKGDFGYSIWQYGKRRPVLIDLVVHPDQDYGRMGYTEIRQEGPVVTAQREMVLPDGRPLVLSMVASPLYDADGSITGAIESVRDITRIKSTEKELARLNADLEEIVRARTQALNDEVSQRRRAEQEVQAALEYNRSIIEANPDLMVVLDTNGTILDVNAAAEALTGVPREQLAGTSYTRYLTDDETPPDIMARLLDEGRLEYSVRLRRADGRIVPLSVNSTLFHGKDAAGARIIVAAHDITRQKQDEAAIQASLDQKVLLLREIYHRVNNNLQIIISLAKLQMRTHGDPKVNQILTDMQNRVRAMALVHEKLYRSDDLSSIDLSDYTRFLANQLFSVYGIDHRKVALETSMDDVELDINTAIPLGLVLNELISNALRHAFPGDRTGTLRIDIRTGGGQLSITVGDNGTGLAPAFDWQNADSLGLRLVNSLVDQAGGTIRKAEGPGTVFVITLPVKQEGAHAGA